MRKRQYWLGFVGLILVIAQGLAWGSEPLTGDAIETVVSGNTVGCRKEKDQRMCSNYFAEQGVIKRLMHDDGARKEGRWFIDDSDRLCILWTDKTRPLCFIVTQQKDGTYFLTKKGRHITTITGVESGNTEGL